MGFGFSSGHRFREGDLVAERGEPLVDVRISI
jgi:hypothetical protein